jgi:hypothetical protein
MRDRLRLQLGRIRKLQKNHLNSDINMRLELVAYDFDSGRPTTPDLPRHRAKQDGAGECGSVSTTTMCIIKIKIDSRLFDCMKLYLTILT